MKSCCCCCCRDSLWPALLCSALPRPALLCLLACLLACGREGGREDSWTRVVVRAASSNNWSPCERANRVREMPYPRPVAPPVEGSRLLSRRSASLSGKSHAPRGWSDVMRLLARLPKV
ncbi:hypothetical protein MPTK1_7g01890 [Marchantia polymorpha subsp. ruderalis]